MLKRILLLSIITVAMFWSGCGSGNSSDAVLPECRAVSDSSSHQLWGLWQFVMNPDAGTMDAVPLRDAAMHLNALHFLEPPPFLNLSLDSLEINGNIVDAVIGLRHPFLGLNEFTGFDVCGIFITHGSISGFDNPDIIMAGPGDTHLTNPDGYTRWWNPAEFPYNGSMFSYKDGLLGTPDSSADFNSTVNAYKLFCNDLDDPDDPVGALDPSNRCVFGAGQKNTRRYLIQMSGGLVFNYAVDASWKFPEGAPPYNVPDDFAPDANRAEAWNISVTETENSLWNDGADSGGELGLLIDVWDHFDAGLNTVTVESPGNFSAASSASPIGGGAGYSTYYIYIDNATPAEDSIGILIEAACETTGYQGILPGEDITAYFIHASDVSPNSPSNSTLHIISPNGGESLEQDCPYEIEWESSGDPIADVKLEYSTDGFIADINDIVASTPNDGFYDWDVPLIESDTVRVRVSDVLNPATKDVSDDDFSVDAPGEPIWPTYKYDVSRHGISPNTGPSTNHIQWTFPCTTQTTPGPSIGWDGTIYIGTNDGHLHAVFPDGTERFTLALGSFILGTPAIAPDGTVYAGTWDAAPKLYAIRCEGDIEWEFSANNNFNKCHPVIGDDGTIYIGDNGGRFYAINPDGTEKWHYDSYGGYVPSPCIGPDDEIYFAMSSSSVYGFNDLGQGSYDLFWQHTFPGEHITNSPSVDGDGHVYCCGLYLNTVWVCDPDTDTILWTFDAPDGFDEASVSIDVDGTIYIGCNDNTMYAVNPGGSVKWSTPVADRIPSSVIIDPAGHLYFGTRNSGGSGGVFYCLNKTNGNIIWSYPTGETIRCTAAIAPDGTLYVGGHDGLLKAFKDE